ncbi:unnamed protein product [Musa acuminata subsp. malaccensis]|uniref:(wild Malaysian banana) hypothetical protein n=2 Tax=Musa acuminata TaxID=4641 RepID=A0A804HWJ4_MUSAM|nr:PREDICTED: AAA-ATPase At3g28510-like [Musa acuminata subsp. malaccensis]CAG1860172.1 unnamed protein product [Musa acuminata subsp. malaccensis]
MDTDETITDAFVPDEGNKGKGKAIKVKWSYHRQQIRRGDAGTTQKKLYKLTLGARQWRQVGKQYLSHVMRTSHEAVAKNRERMIFTNSARRDELWEQNYVDHQVASTQAMLEHPASFAMLAMEPKKKQEIIDDLETFSKSQDYYAKIGKAWKRGYLLYGPPGTGKSTMIGCMANFLNYDVYDIDLTAVKDNTELRHLIVNTGSKSIIVIEDIDCSLHLSGSREAKKSNQGNKESVDEEKGDEGKSKATLSGPLNFIDGQKKVEGTSKVTLSGLLNSIDGLWSACGGERLIVFTTNHVEELDPALIRRGRMDVHIELGYCGFEAFKVLAKNYLEVEEHPLFEKVKDLLEKVNISPAEVAESLMPKNLRDEDKASQCLRDLVRTLDQKIQEEDGGKGKKETQVKQ